MQPSDNTQYGKDFINISYVTTLYDILHLDITLLETYMFWWHICMLILQFDFQEKHCVNSQTP